MISVSFIHPGSMSNVSGGTNYDKKILDHLSNYVKIQVHEISGRFPIPDQIAKHEFTRVLSEFPSILIIDGLAIGLLQFIDTTLTKTSIFVIYHNPLHQGSNYTGAERQILVNYDTTYLKIVDGIICTSEFSKAYLEQLGIHTPKLFAPPGVISRVANPRKKNLTNTILFVGVLSPRKNQLWALEQIIHYHRPLTIILVGPIGDYKYHEKLVQIQSEIHTIILTGTVESLDPYYTDADVFIHVPKHESYGMVLTEAMSFGLPIIASEVDGIPKTIGESGMLIEPNDPNQLLKALDILLTNDEVYEQASTRSVLRFEQLVDWEHVTSQIWTFINKIS